MNLTKKIVVLGGAVAGVTTAIGLKKLGFDVSIIYKKRAFRAYEGFSQKTKEGFDLIGCQNSVKLLNTKSLRDSNWADIKSKTNYEYVVCRDDFDKALLEDAKEYKINLIKGRVLDQREVGNKIIIRYKSDKEEYIDADFIVDARGRFTPFKAEYYTGPKSFSILQELELEKFQENKTSIDCITDGWIWQAYVGNNRGYIQFTCDEKNAKNINSFEDVKQYLKNEKIDLWSLENCKIKGKIVKRDSYCKIHKTIITDKMILVGDSASSIDPLSGNGVFQALSMSSIAPYVVNTILNKSFNKEIAKEFYKKRVNYIFNKFSKVGKEFYCMEKRFSSSFWIKRQSWPKLESEEFKSVQIANYAVVKDNFIEPKEVVITKNNPMGIYFLEDLEVVELVKYCLKNSLEDSLMFFEKFCYENLLTLEKMNLLKRWLLKERII